VKTCFKCGRSFPLSGFYLNCNMPDGHINKCRECARRDQAEYYAATRVARSAYERWRQQQQCRREKKREYLKARRQRHPDRNAARQALNNAVRDGRVVRRPCVYCGGQKSQGHHPDYSKPLDVVWACFRCHRERGHGQVVISDGNG
jgi:hypothetical protein